MGEDGGVSECIHGLESDVCDVCSPRRAPERPRAARVSAPRARSAPAPAVASTRTNRVEQRVYLVVARSRLAEVLGALDEQDWRSELGSATDAFRWPDAAEVERPAELAVLVANLAGEIQVIAAANEPARRAVREELALAGVDARVVLQPGWWA